MRRIKLALTLAAMLIVAPTASADVIISNLPGNDGGGTFINAPSGGSNGGTALDSKAAGFTMPVGQDYSLDSVSLRLQFFSSDSAPILEIYDDVTGNPGSPLLTLNSPSVVVGTDTFTFTPPSSFTLVAGATYWVVLTNDAAVANSFVWLANSPGTTPTGIAASAGYRFDFGPPPPTTSSGVLNSYEVSATAVAIPEPTTAAILGLTIVGLAGATAGRSTGRRLPSSRPPVPCLD